MKSLFYYIRNIFTVFFFLTVCMGVEALMPIGGLTGVTVASATGILAILAGNPQIWQKWTEQAFRQGESKTEFNESEIGTGFAKDGPKKNHMVKAAPILYEQKLASGGRYINIQYKNPLFTEDEEILNKGRYHKQSREGSEASLSEQYVKTIVDMHHLGVTEDDIEEGFQQSANTNNAGKLMKAFVEGLTNNMYQRKDRGVFYALSAGYDIHHYINAGLRKELSNGDKPVSDAEMGLLAPPEEHPNLFVWHENSSDELRLKQVTYSATQATYSANIRDDISLITSDAKPGLALFRRISRLAKNLKMIPCKIKLHDGRDHNYFLCLIPGGIKDLAEEDENYFKLMSNAHMGLIEKNPLLKEGDVLYKNLVIRDSFILDQDYFNARNSFMATGVAESDTDNDDETTDMSFDLAGADNEASIAPGIRKFKDSSAAAADFGGLDHCNLVKRIHVLGANAVTRSVGKNFKLVPKTLTEYDSKAGVGQTSFFGHQLVKAYNASGTFVKAPQSFQVLAFAGD